MLKKGMFGQSCSPFLNSYHKNKTKILKERLRELECAGCDTPKSPPFPEKKQNEAQRDEIKVMQSVTKTTYDLPKKGRKEHVYQ